jgi:hypothetical protein
MFIVVMPTRIIPRGLLFRCHLCRRLAPSLLCALAVALIADHATSIHGVFLADNARQQHA